MHFRVVFGQVAFDHDCLSRALLADQQHRLKTQTEFELDETREQLLSGLPFERIFRPHCFVGN